MFKINIVLSVRISGEMVEAQQRHTNSGSFHHSAASQKKFTMLQNERDLWTKASEPVTSVLPSFRSNTRSPEKFILNLKIYWSSTEAFSSELCLSSLGICKASKLFN